MSSNKNAANGEFISPKKIFVFSQSSKRLKELVLVIAISLQRGEVRFENPYCHIIIEKIWS